jgi:hypothetical protein
MEDEKRDSLDDLLDASLARYASVEPRTGLEGRVIARLRAERERPRWTWAWQLAAAGLATLLAVALIMHVERGRGPVRKAGAANASVTRIAPPTVASAPVIARQPAKRTAGRTVKASRASAPSTLGPRRSMFPSPAPLTTEERLLVRYVETAKQPNLPAFRSDDTIAALQIKKLEVSPLDEESNGQ